jgi:hypothetical protein
MTTTNLRQSAGAPLWVAALCVLAAGAATVTAADLPNRAARYSRMAPIDQYLMDAGAEIALARSAAPAAISGKAEILVLKAEGYETAVAGTNGFTCVVERSWMAPFDHPEFWNPRIRGPICYNPAASRSVLKYTLWRTTRALAGNSREQLLNATRAALASKDFPPPEPGAMSYMMSREGYLGDGAGHWHSHLMFHVPKVAAASWGANFAGSPVVVDGREIPEQTIFMVPVAHWSDGSEAPGL